MLARHTSTRKSPEVKSINRCNHYFPSGVGSSILAILLAALAAASFSAAQDASSVRRPYAVINRQAIDYSGPDRQLSRDLPGQEIKIGILVPLEGARQAEGEAILQAARMAVEDESASPFAGGHQLVLVARDETGLWGRASSELVRFVIDDQAVALVTSTNGSAAHLAEQVGNRLGVPVLALSSDSTTTEINIPWFFRLAPDDAAQARLFAEDIYHHRGLDRVVLITEPDHDGREGGEQFEKAARRLGAPAPLQMVVGPSRTDRDQVAAKIIDGRPQAIVLWTGAEAAAQLLEEWGANSPATPVYVCQKALNEPFLSVSARSRLSVWRVAQVGSKGPANRDFAGRFRARTGENPSPAAAEAYDAVRLIAAGVRRAGPNRARLRDALVNVPGFSGASGEISFDGAGNNQAEAALVKLAE
jgi:branched-chain amino acid transport system substrate-binding protein